MHVLPPLELLIQLPAGEKRRLADELARSLGSAWAVGHALVGALEMIELIHASGHPFVVLGASRFVRGLREDERPALVTAMLGAHEEDPDVDWAAERAFVEREIPREVQAPELVELPPFLLGREPFPVARLASSSGSRLQDLGYPEALGGAAEWLEFTESLPDQLTLPSEDQWELVARRGGDGSWIVPMPDHGFPGLWPPEHIFSHENRLGVRSLAVGEVFASGYRRGVGDGRGNWGGSSGNAELHAAARWAGGFGASRLARVL